MNLEVIPSPASHPIAPETALPGPARGVEPRDLPPALRTAWRATRRTLRSAARFLRRQRPWHIFGAAVAVACGVCWLDYATGWAVSVSVLYAAPIALAAWFAGGRFGLGVAVVSGVCWAVANGSTHPYGHQALYALATFSRTAYFLVTAIAAWAFRKRTDEMQARLRAITRAAELEREIARLSEDEKRRIGQELHDGMCQTLSAIDCAVSCLQLDLDDDPEAARHSVRAIQDMLKSATLEARRLARGLFPLDLTSSGLPHALEELARRLAASYRIAIETDLDPSVHVDDALVALNLYRITQEALSNALRHAGGTQLTLSLRREGPVLVLSVRDHGRGLPHGHGKTAGMGLETMRHRADSIGAAFTLDSAPGQGTTIRCSWSPRG